LRVDAQMYEKQILEKWINQIKNDQLSPEFVGEGLNKEQAIKKLQEQLNKLNFNKP
jgi:hypothetical protein